MHKCNVVLSRIKTGYLDASRLSIIGVALRVDTRRVYTVHAL